MNYWSREGAEDIFVQRQKAIRVYWIRFWYSIAIPLYLALPLHTEFDHLTLNIRKSAPVFSIAQAKVFAMHSSQSSSTFPLKAQWAFPEKASCPKPEDPNNILEEKSKDEERLNFLDATDISRESNPDADEIPTSQPSIFLPPFSRNQLLCPSYEEYIARQ